MGLIQVALAGDPSWKYGLALPTAFFTLGLLGRTRSRLVQAVVVVGFGVTALADDYRSLFAFCLLTATLTLWQARPRSSDGVNNRWFPALLIAGMGVTAYLLLSTLLTSGYLGSEVGGRTVEQVETSGSLLAGGRPEWLATRELVLLRPQGYGAGVVPNWADLHAAKSGLASVNVELEQKRDGYMFGGEFRLHSITGDLWVRYGWLGLALAVTILITLIRSLSFRLAARDAPTPVILITLLSLWAMGFEPSYSYWVEVCVATGLVIYARPDRSPAPDHATW